MAIKTMAQTLLTSLGKIGIGLAVVGGVVQSALFNGTFLRIFVFFTLLIIGLY